MDRPLLFELGADTFTGLSHWKGYSSGAVISKTKCASNRKGRMHVIEETPCLEPDRRKASVRNLRGEAGNGPSENCLNGMLGYNQAI